MSVIQRIRDKGSWIMFAIIALALIAFILQDSSFKTGSIFSDNKTIGKINGVKIDKGEFEQKIQTQAAMYGGNAAREQIQGMVWEQEVNRILMKSQYIKLGLEVTGKEISDILFGENSPLKQEFTDQATGRFKVEEARTVIANIQKGKNKEQLQMLNEQLIKPTIENTLNTKYQNLLQQGVYVPKWMIEKQQADNSSIASISFVNVPYSSIADSTIKVSDDDIAAYIKKNPADYKKQEETRSISYVIFDATATSTDSASALNNILSLKSEFSTTGDMKNFLQKVGTELAYGDLFAMKNKMQMPKADSIKALGIGKTFGPYIDGSNFVLARMLDKRTMPDSIKCRHILVKTEDGRRPVMSDSLGKKRIDSVVSLVNAGTDFNELVQKYSDDAGSKATKGEYEFSSSQGLSKEFYDFVFFGKAGEKKVVKVENDSYAGFHYIEIISQKAIGEAAKVAYLAKPILVSNETDNAARTAADQFAATTKNKKDFDQNIIKLNKAALPATEIKAAESNIPGLGVSRELVRWIYENEPGDISEAKSLQDKYVVAMITAVSPKGLMSVKEARPLTENIVRNQKKAKQIIETKFKENNLETLASANMTSVQRADSISFGAPFIPAVGNEPKVVGTGFNKSLLNKVSAPIEGNSGVFAVRVENIAAKPAVNNDPEAIKQSLLQGPRMALYRGQEVLKKSAEIKDYRSKFF